MSQVQTDEVNTMLAKIYPEGEASMFKLNRLKTSDVEYTDIWNTIDLALEEGVPALEALKSMYKNALRDPEGAKHASAMIQFIDDFIETVVRNMPT